MPSRRLGLRLLFQVFSRREGMGSHESRSNLPLNLMAVSLPRGGKELKLALVTVQHSTNSPIRLNYYQGYKTT